MAFLRTKRPQHAQRRNGQRPQDQHALHSPQSVDFSSESAAGEEDPGASLDMVDTDAGTGLPMRSSGDAASPSRPGKPERRG